MADAMTKKMTTDEFCLSTTGLAAPLCDSDLTSNMHKVICNLTGCLQQLVKHTLCIYYMIEGDHNCIFDIARLNSNDV